MSDRSPGGRIWLDPERLDFGEHAATDTPIVKRVLVRCTNISDPKGFYAALGVSPSATHAELRRAYRRLIKEVHPDRNPDDPRAQARSIEVQTAWEELRDPAQRAAYDGAIEFHYEPEEGAWWTAAVREPEDDPNALVELEVRAFFSGGILPGLHETPISIDVWGEQLTLTLRMALSDHAHDPAPSSGPAAADDPPPSPVAPSGGPVAAGSLSPDAIWRWLMELSPRAQGMLAIGGVGWVILLVALLGGCNKTVTQTITTPPITVTTTVPADTSTQTTPTDTSTTDSGSVGTSQDAVTLAVLDANGNNDPVEDIGRVLDFSVQSATDSYLYVTDRPAGGAGCAPTYSGDSGSGIVNGESIPSGTQDVRQTATWPDAGSSLFCMWIATSSDDPNSHVFSQTIKFRQPRGSIAFGHPSVVYVNQPVTLRFHGASEAPRELFVTERAAGGAGCAPTYGTDSGTGLISGTSINGAYNEPYVRTLYKAGTYLYCVWLAESSGDTRPVARVSFVLRVR